MERRSAQEPSFQPGTTLHRIKMWLSAPVVIRRQVPVENIEAVHETEPVSSHTSEARGAQKPTVQPGTTLQRVKTWLNAPVLSQHQVRVKNVEAVHDTKPIFSTAGPAALVLHVCWASIVLGLTIQISLLIASLAFGRVPKLNPLIVDLA